MHKKSLKYYLVALALIQWASFSIIFQNKKWIEQVLHHFSFPYTRAMVKLTNGVLFPLGELFYALIIAIVVVIIYGLIQGFRLKRQRLLSNSMVFFLVFINAAYFIYSMVWGIHYHKDTIVENHVKVKIEVNNLKKLYCSNLYKAIELRSMLQHTENEPLHFKLTDADYQQIFLSTQRRLDRIAFIKNYQFIKNPHYKYSNISLFQNYLGILGYYNPFSAEANINGYNTDLKKGITIFHEYAHQMGFASESEANFISYYIAIHSGYNTIAYAAYYKSLFSLLAAIQKEDPFFVKNEMLALHSLIQRDRQEERRYYEKYTGKVSDGFSHLNDQFLKANAQEGTVSYSHYIELIYRLEFNP